MGRCLNGLFTVSIALRLLLISVCLTLFACNNSTQDAEVSIIPQVSGIDVSEGEITLATELNLIYQEQQLDAAAMEFAEFTAQNSEFRVSLNAVSVQEGATPIHLEIAEQTSLGAEGYQLSIKQGVINITAQQSAGVFYGLQSLKQLLLHDVQNKVLPQLTIVDSPAYSYRGLMLDVSRHFYTVEQVKQILDLMALYKLNKFHWHLTDDNGWRIEIKSLPLLTEIGAYRNESQVEKNFNPFVGDGIPHEGFYSQADIIDIVNYAQQRHIEVIPEIDMPGHVTAALAAYPELACQPGPYQVSGRWGIHRDIFCPNDATFDFIAAVLTEVAALFPSQYIHLGGDEVPITRWQQSELAQQFIQKHDLADEHALQGYFFEWMNDVLANLGKTAIVWDETLEKSISSKPVIMAWRNENWIEEAVNNNHPVIMAVRDYSYFDYAQGDHSNEPLAQCCRLTLKDVYHTPTFEQLNSELILGGQAQVWTAFISDYDHLQYMLLPRMLAHAEVYWTPTTNKNWQNFEQRLTPQLAYFDRANINYRQQ